MTRKVGQLVSNIQSRAQDNNLKLNCAKSREVIFTDPKRRRQHVDPPSIPGILRRRELQMLGVTLVNDFTVTEHVYKLATKFQVGISSNIFEFKDHRHGTYKNFAAINALKCCQQSTDDGRQFMALIVHLYVQRYTDVQRVERLRQRYRSFND